MKTTNEKITAVTTQIDTAGAISYWRLSGAVQPSRLRAQWVSRGLDEKLLPSLPAPEVALRRAVIELAGKRRLVRPLKNRAQWVVLDESVTPDGQNVDHVKVCTVKYEKGAVINSGDADPAVSSAAQALVLANYQRTQNELAPEDISHWLITLAEKQNAISLRETGGVYFVPQPGVAFWQNAVAAIEAASEHKVFQIPAVKDSDAVAAILDAINEEARRAIEAIERELDQEGDDALGARALETRAGTADKILAKVASYETLLDTRMGTLRDRIDGLKANLAAASLKSETSAAA